MKIFIVVVFYLLLFDSIVVNILAWSGSEWYIKHFRIFSRYFPITKGWAVWYFILTLWIGFLIFYLQ